MEATTKSIHENFYGMSKEFYFSDAVGGDLAGLFRLVDACVSAVSRSWYFTNAVPCPQVAHNPVCRWQHILFTKSKRTNRSLQLERIMQQQYLNVPISSVARSHWKKLSQPLAENRTWMRHFVRYFLWTKESSERKPGIDWLVEKKEES